MAVSQEELNGACEALAEAIANGDDEKKQRVVNALETVIDHLETYAETYGGG